LSTLLIFAVDDADIPDSARKPPTPEVEGEEGAEAPPASSPVKKTTPKKAPAKKAKKETDGEEKEVKPRKVC
jgi:hypothetical protein